MSQTEATRSSSIALLAGSGKLPELVSRELNNQYDRVLGCLLTDDNYGDLSAYLDESRSFSPSNFGSLLEYIDRIDVDHLVMCGKVDRTLLFDDETVNRADQTVTEALNQLDEKDDESIITLAGDLIREQGVTVVALDEILNDYFTPEGHIGGPTPDSGSLDTLHYLAARAVMLADAEIGQAIVGKRQSVVAVEAAEGTTEMIRRSGGLMGDGGVFLKVARTNQDFRYDVPVVGEETVRALIDVNASLLAAEANETIWVQREQCRSLAEEHGLSLMGWTRGNKTGE